MSFIDDSALTAKIAELEARLDAHDSTLIDHDARLTALESGGASTPGIEGYAGDATGGAGGQEMVVTSLAEFMGALGSNRVIKLQFAGEHLLSAMVKLKNLSNLTIDGSGFGPTFRNGTNNFHVMKAVGCNNLVLRNFRLAGAPNGQYDCLNIYQCSNVALDHLSLRWGSDENLGITDCTDVTVQWCILSEGLFDPLGTGTGHSCGALIRELTTRVNLHHCLFAHNYSRCPQFGQVDDPSAVFDLRNLVIYNTGIWSGGVRAAVEFKKGSGVNLVGCNYKSGQNQNANATHWAVCELGSIYLEDNAGDLPNVLSPAHQSNVIPSPVFVPPISTLSAADAWDAVLDGAGCFPRDSVDERVVEDVRSGTGALVDVPSS